MRRLEGGLRGWFSKFLAQLLLSSQDPAAILKETVQAKLLKNKNNFA